MLAVRNLEEENKYIFFATRNGLVKKSELREFMAKAFTAARIRPGARYFVQMSKRFQQRFFRRCWK